MSYLGDTGGGVNIPDPAYNALLGWDNIDGSPAWFHLGSGLSYNHLTHTLSATGAGGGINVGDPVGGAVPNAVLFIDGSGNLGADPNFTYDTLLGLLSMSFAGNGTFIVDPNTQFYALGGYSGGGLGNALEIDNSIGGDFIRLIGSSGRRFLYQGGASQVYELGDIDDQDTHVHLRMDAALNKLSYYHGVGFSNLYFNIDGSTNVYQMGEISGLVLNNNYLEIDAGNNTVTLFGNMGGFNAGARFFHFKGGTSTVEMGDVGIVQNGTVLRVDDSGKIISAITDQSFEVTNTSGKTIFQTIETGHQIQFGDLASASNGSIFFFGDAALLWTISAQANQLLNYNLQKIVFELGDISGGGNSGLFVLDDLNQLTTIQTAGEFRAQSPAGNRYLSVNPSSGVVQVGDIDGVFASGYVLIDSGAGNAFSNALNWDMGNTIISNVMDPLLAQDVATKAYVDSASLGLNWKAIVDVATTGPLPASTYNNGAAGIGATLTGNTFAPLGPVDSYVPVVGQSILVKDEVLPANDGIYVFTQDGNGSSQSWILTRRTDCDQPAEIRHAATPVIQNGAINSNSAWTQTATIAGVGVTPQVWIQFLNTIYNAGAGLTLLGHIFSLDLTHANTWSGIQTFESGMLRMHGATSGFASLSAAAVTTTYGLFLPPAQGAAGETLVNDGFGNLSWGAGGGSQAGIQFDDETGAPLGTSGTVDEVELSGAVTGTRAGNKVTYVIGGGASNDFSLVAAMRFLSGN